MPRNKPRTQTQIQEDRAFIAKAHREGIPQYQIAKQLGLSPATISLELKALREIWAEQAIEDIDTVLTKQLAIIDAIEFESWEAWFESKKPAETEVVKDGMSADKITDMTITTKRGQTGNPAYLDKVQWCVEQRLKIYGLYKQPTANDPSFNFNMMFLTQINNELAEIEQETQDKIIDQYPMLKDYLPDASD